jgi:hypothetical protein
MEEKDIVGQYRRRILLDSILYIIIILALSIALIFISVLPKETDTYYENYQESDENIEQSMDSFLHSTVPRVEFVYDNGLEKEYVGLTVEELLIEELLILSSDDEYNSSDLEDGIESHITELLSSSFSSAQQYILTVKFDKSDNNGHDEPVIVISNFGRENEPDKSDKAVYTKYIDLTTSGRFKLPGSSIVIKFYLM